MGREVLGDIRKDLLASSVDLPYPIVWCAGLPKSGTTRIEQVLESLPYVDVSTSILRRLHRRGALEHDHALPEGLFSRLPKKRYSFVKTHSHFNQQWVNEAIAHDVRIIVSFRDLRDMMISRYFHIMASPEHWQHAFLIGLPEEQGFLASLRSSVAQQEDPATYYYNWITEWRSAVQGQADYLTVQYEDFHQSPDEGISSILKFLGADCLISTEQVRSRLDALAVLARNTSYADRIHKIGRSKSTLRQGGQGPG